MTDETELAIQSWEVWQGEGWTPRKGIVEADTLIIEHGVLIFYRGGKIIEAWPRNEWTRVIAVEAG